MLKRLLPVFLILIITSFSGLFAQSLADSGYYYQKIGFKEKAAGFFENYIYSNPDNFQVRLDLAYLYLDTKQITKAREQFDYVGRNSPNENEVKQSKESIAVIDNQTGQVSNTQTTTVPGSTGSDLDSGYYYLNSGNKTKAAIFFEQHLKSNPKDTKIHLQLAYIYYDQKKYANALTHFDYVGKHSTNSDERQLSKSASLTLREDLAFNSPRSLDLYFYNYYDSFQENYIANLVTHVNFRIGKGFFAGPYLDVYTDTRSSKTLVYNDRFVEIGGFFRYHVLNNLFFEFRLGYTRQIDLDSSKINIKPMVVYYNRFGDAKLYLSKGSSSSKTSLYMDIYYAAMYDYKYKNAFLQASLTQALRFHTGGYSYIENYLVENAQFDSRRLDYNNYFEVGLGLRFKPNVMVFPVFFVEPSYKAYFFGDRKNSFQIKAGFWFNFRTKL
ncbi:MAG: tetratricopeptide repeat protein [Ignavibacteria bacterium]|nr:tetratricopeptide repeat protein [Ignavibacteria bacterium]MCC7158885.1 tetratricopeptide repeat protein [Ignavibacteria bacterium]